MAHIVQMILSSDILMHLLNVIHSGSGGHIWIDFSTWLKASSLVAYFRCKTLAS